MDLREKFLRDLFDCMHRQNQDPFKYEELQGENLDWAEGMAEMMLKKGWYCDTEKGK